MLKLSRSVYEEYAKSHRALWRWCAETGEYKHRYPGWFGNLNKYPRYTVKYISSYKHAHILNDCFACEIANRNWDGMAEEVCDVHFCYTRCPIVGFRACGPRMLSMPGGCVNPIYGLFYKYMTAKSENKTKMYKKYALDIAELPWFEYEIYMKYLGVRLYDFDLVEIKNAYGSLEFKF